MTFPIPQDNLVLPTGRISQAWQRYMQLIRSQVGDVTAYTPTVLSSVGTITTAIGSARYQVIGKQVHLCGSAQVVTNGTGAGTLLVTLPSNLWSPYYQGAQPVGSGSQFITATTSRSMQVTMGSLITVPRGQSYWTAVCLANTDGTYPAVGTTTYFSIVYETN